jgi:molybdenum cofactor cytidylyltransferase
VTVRIVGVLLAAGRGERFGGAKLLVPLPAGPHAGAAVGVAACRNLRAALDDVVTVVRAGDDALAAAFVREGAQVVVAERAAAGMGASLAAGVAAAGDADGYVVALADMPWIAPATIRSVADAIAGGASIAAPRFGGRQGHPVGFAAAHRAALVALAGDAGARSIVTAHAPLVRGVDVDDPGIVRDVDLPDDLR